MFIQSGGKNNSFTFSAVHFVALSKIFVITEASLGEFYDKNRMTHL